MILHMKGSKGPLYTVELVKNQIAVSWKFFTHDTSYNPHSRQP